MDIEELPLLELFTRLQNAGLSLGIGEYKLLLQAIRGGFGFPDRSALARLCCTLWVKSPEDKRIFDYHCASSKLAKLQRKLEDKNRSKKAKRLLRKTISRLHQKITRQRKHWHYTEAHNLVKNCQVLAIEDLKIRNMKRRNKPKKVDGIFVPNGQAASTGMNKSWSDNGVGNFLEILSQVAQKYGTRIIKVNAKGTSQYCSQCLNRVSKTLSDRWHNCDNDSCQLSCDRDYNSAMLIKKLAVGSSQDKTLPSLKDLMS
ncbi:MAG: transposase [Xenococcaceae cyanobacterium MO_167.B27]|nr:transposase [Xenococcaceae cyanobacterium MO_167.B27]